MKKPRKRKKTKKQTAFERVRAKVANYVAKGTPLHDAEAMARHAMKKLRR